MHEITIDFEMLGDTDEYSEMKKMERVLLYDTVHAVNERIGLDKTVEVTELEWDAIREKVAALKLSNVGEIVSRSVTGFTVVNRSISGNKLTDEAGDELVGRAVDRAFEESGEYTDSKVGQLRSWVNTHFQPIS